MGTKKEMDELLTLINVGEVLNRSDSIEEASNLVLDAVNIGFGVEECAIMTADELGNIQLKGVIGMDAGRAEAVREYVETLSRANIARMLESLTATDGGRGDDEPIHEMIANGEIVLVPGSGDIEDDFLAVPLRSAKRLVGVITLHKIRGKHIREIENTDDIKRLFKIVAMQVSPYFFIGLSLDEKRTMKMSPFGCFLDLLKGHFDAVKQYFGIVSLAVLKVENYNALCQTMGVDNATLRVQEIGAAISSAIEKVHEATRITEIKFVFIFPMVDKMEAADIIAKAVATAVPGDDVILKHKIVSYPEDGDTPAQLMFLAYV